MESKRVLTDDVRASSNASNAPPQTIDPDLALQLRSVASRVRKSVFEGYRTPSAFHKSYSTGHIFRSASDTLRDVYDSPNIHPPLSHSTKKRSRAASDQGYNSDGSAPDDDQADDASMSAPADRPVKALRKPRRTMLTTRSLPAGALPLGAPINSSVAMDSLQEEDWSIPSAPAPALPHKPSSPSQPVTFL